jgi:nitroreductase
MSLDFLQQRLSVPSRTLVEPAPDPAQLEALLAAALRVPDHGRLEPFRLLLIRGDARRVLGEHLVRIRAQKDPGLAEASLQKDRNRFNFAPLIVTVISRLTKGHKIPEQEQLLSAGCVAYNLLLGAQALGFGAQWLTAWMAYDAEVKQLLGVGEDEGIVGFIHIGTPSVAPSEHMRPDPSSVVSEWNPGA